MGRLGPPEWTGDYLQGAGQTLHLLWAPRVFVQEGRPPLGVARVPQGRQRHSTQDTRLLATPSPHLDPPVGHPAISSIRDGCPSSQAFCVCSSPERIQASHSSAKGLGVFSWNFSAPSLPPHPVWHLCLRPVSHPSSSWAHTCSERPLVSESSQSHPRTQPALCCSKRSGRDHKAAEPPIPQGSAGWASKAEVQAGSGPGESSPTDSTLRLGRGLPPLLRRALIP